MITQKFDKDVMELIIIPYDQKLQGIIDRFNSALKEVKDSPAAFSANEMQAVEKRVIEINNLINSKKWY